MRNEIKKTLLETLKVIAGYGVIYTGLILTYSLWALGIGYTGKLLNLPLPLTGTLNRAGGIAVCIFLTSWVCKHFLKKELKTLAFKKEPGWFKELTGGCLTALAAMALLYGVYNGSGWIQLSEKRFSLNQVSLWLPVLWKSLLVNSYAALTEEILFRAYLLSGFKEILGKGKALILMSLIFALSHLLVSSSRQVPLPLFLLGLTGPGLLLGWAYLKTGSLWLPVGIHFMWNLAQDDLFNLPGRIQSETLFGYINQIDAPSWLTGNSFGIETGFVLMIPLTLCFLGTALLTFKRKPVKQRAL